MNISAKIIVILILLSCIIIFFSDYKTFLEDQDKQNLRLTISQEKSDSTKNIPLNSFFKALPESKFKDQFLLLSFENKEKIMKRFTLSPQLTNDINSLRLTYDGEIYYHCFSCNNLHKIKKISLPTSDKKINSRFTSSVSINTPPILSSRPQSNVSIYLDFNGEIVQGTTWNLGPGNAAIYNCRPFDKDGNESTFSVDEQEQIVYIWSEVVEDFSGFDVNITTVEPADNTYFYHALITPGTDQNGVNCPHWDAGGIAILGTTGTKITDYSFENIKYYSPAWIRSEGSKDNIGMIISHEIGHNLTLSHHGYGTNEYYSGHVNSYNGFSIPKWGPIMGNPYNKNITQWSKGEYRDANNTLQDDLAVLDFQFGYTPDDHPDSLNTAALLQDNEIVGLINNSSDEDCFKFILAFDQSVTFNLYPYTNSTYGLSNWSWGGNSDLVLELYNESFSLITSENPIDELAVAYQTFLTAGTYYIKIKSTGAGDPFNSLPSGYSNYGSRGRYNMVFTDIINTDADGDGMLDSWEQQYFNTITFLPNADADADGFNNLDEFIAGTNPTNSNSFFNLNAFKGDNNFILQWNSVDNRIYNVLINNNLIFGDFNNLSGDLPYPINSYTDVVQRTGNVHYYKLEVR